MDAGRKQPIIWVSGPAGSGKTTVVTNYLDERAIPSLWYQVDEGDADIAAFFYYMGLAARKTTPRNRKTLPLLTPEYLQGINTFTRRYFESLYSRLKQPFALVFDNYQDAPFESKFHEVMREGLSSIPEGIMVILISRSEPPPVFARLRLAGRMRFVGWDDIRFDLDETRELARFKKNDHIPDTVLEQLYARTKGWAAGIVLMLERIRTETASLSVSDKFTHEEIFHFFAGELFEKADQETQAFLLRSAFLPSMTVQAAQELTGTAGSGRILEALTRNHFFTERDLSASPAYQFHPLFREFLLARAEHMLSAGDLFDLRRNAAAVLEKNGQAEPAAELMRSTGDWPGLARLINACAQTFITQGRTQTIEGWLRGFPEAYRENDPWLEYWLGMCRLPFDPAESQRHFERAFDSFKTRKDPAGVFLSWAGIMEAILLGWGEFTQVDRWIGILEELLREQPLPLSPDIDARVTTSMLFALTLRQPHHPGIRAWVGRALALARITTNIRLKSFINVYLELYYLWIGDHAGAEVVLKGVRESASTPGASPLAQILGRVIEAVYQVRMGEHDLCRKAVVEGLEIAAATGIVIWNSQLYSQGAINALSEGNAAEAGEYLKKMGEDFLESRRIDACMYHYNSAWDALTRRDLSRAFQQGEMALRFALEAGTPFHEGISRIALAQVLHEQGADQKADANLAQGGRIAARMKSRILEFMCLVSQTHFAMDRHDEIKTVEHLVKAMTLGREEGYTNFYWWRTDVMGRICARALEHGIEADYVRELIRKRHVPPPVLSEGGEGWPWPVKICSLGRFEIIRDGVPVRFAGKVQQKPLALLKALVAFGGKDVAEEQFTDALWPDADGDLAHKSFEMTVQRLRRLIGNDKIIRLHERRLTLDSSLCWVDVWALEDLLSNADAAWKRARGDQEAVQYSNKAIELYGGHFLPGDSTPWILSYRERLRSKFLRIIIKLGELREQAMQWKGAVEVFQKGLEVDGIAEDFYQHLMLCYKQLGQRAEAIAVYHRCRALLSSTLGIAPSSHTEDLYQTIRNSQ